MKQIKVMVVDDSAVVRTVLKQILSHQFDIQVIAAVPDPLFAMERMKTDWPDVIVLDIEMPRMDGLTFLSRLMAERPTPVVICSSLAVHGAETTMAALAAGAVSIITKPTLDVEGFLKEASNNIVDAVRGAAAANIRNIRPGNGMVRNAAATGAAATGVAAAGVAAAGVALTAAPLAAMAQTTERIVAIGTSTGGTVALERVLRALPRVSPGIVIVQHMPAGFTRSFAERLNNLCEISVAEAQDGQRLIPGLALIAPGGLHMSLNRSGAQYVAEVRQGPPVNRHCPSVDVLFRSVARCAGRNAMGVIMTGMGDDGARGLKEMHDGGAYTIAQDEATCVVYGMPREAVELGAADLVLPLDRIAASIFAGPPLRH